MFSVVPSQAFLIHVSILYMIKYFHCYINLSKPDVILKIISYKAERLHNKLWKTFNVQTWPMRRFWGVFCDQSKPKGFKNFIRKLGRLTLTVKFIHSLVFRNNHNIEFRRARLILSFKKPIILRYGHSFI